MSDEYNTISYSDLDLQDRGRNTAAVNGKEYYFNGYHTIYSKTAFSMDEGFAGTMIWSGPFDKPQGSEYSLFGAIQSAENNRLAQ